MCHYVTAWLHVVSGSYNLVYCLSFANTWGFSLAYGIRDVTGGFAFPFPVGERAGFSHSCQACVENTPHLIPPPVLPCASAHRAVPSALPHGGWAPLMAPMAPEAVAEQNLGAQAKGKMRVVLFQ